MNFFCWFGLHKEKIDFDQLPKKLVLKCSKCGKIIFERNGHKVVFGERK
ncbi:MAG: hypothetical protein HeimC3_41000 [Candidatus Heimdallarchaeota archaeon LC_3]|nr:MAG: hypothetical protein HeimC3_41000 [Candidatus Heimdallarchaeota archaeon LC_3]